VDERGLSGVLRSDLFGDVRDGAAYPALAEGGRRKEKDHRLLAEHVLEVRRVELARERAARHAAVLFGEDKESFFNVLATPPSPTVPPPHGSFGAPAHLNDYDELWLTHASEFAPDTEGHLWLLPRTLPHPGMKRPSAPSGRDGTPIRSMRINFDTRASVWWTEAARTALFEDPVVAKYTSFFGVPLKAAPKKVRRRAGLA